LVDTERSVKVPSPCLLLEEATWWTFQQPSYTFNNLPGSKCLL